MYIIIKYVNKITFKYDVSVHGGCTGPMNYINDQFMVIAIVLVTTCPMGYYCVKNKGAKCM